MNITEIPPISDELFFRVVDQFGTERFGDILRGLGIKVTQELWDKAYLYVLSKTFSIPLCWNIYLWTAVNSNVRQVAMQRIDTLLLDELNTATKLEDCWKIFHDPSASNKVKQAVYAKTDLILEERFTGVSDFTTCWHIFTLAHATSSVRAKALQKALEVATAPWECEKVFNRAGQASDLAIAAAAKMATLLRVQMSQP